MRRASAVVVALLFFGPPANAGLPSSVRPLDTRADGVYGRFDGDVTFTTTALLELSPGGPAPGARLAAHYFWMAGAYLAVSRPFETARSDRVLATGIELRPAFVPRWALGLEQGPSWLDLVLDSTALGLGTYWQSPARGTFGTESGLEASLALGLPLTRVAPGPWLELRGLVRADGPSGAAAWGAQFGFSWQTSWASPLLR